MQHQKLLSGASYTARFPSDQQPPLASHLSESLVTIALVPTDRSQSVRRTGLIAGPLLCRYHSTLDTTPPPVPPHRRYHSTPGITNEKHKNSRKLMPGRTCKHFPFPQAQSLDENPLRRRWRIPDMRTAINCLGWGSFRFTDKVEVLGSGSFGGARDRALPFRH